VLKVDGEFWRLVFWLQCCVTNAAKRVALVHSLGVSHDPDERVADRRNEDAVGVQKREKMPHLLLGHGGPDVDSRVFL